MTKLNKVEGAKEQCPSCSQTIFCKLTKGSEKYPAKLQWQDADGSAHYSFDFATKSTSCKSSTPKSESSEITMPNASGTDKAVLERMMADAEIVARQKIAKLIGVKKACAECGIVNPAQIGMLFNAVDKEEL